MKASEAKEAQEAKIQPVESAVEEEVVSNVQGQVSVSVSSGTKKDSQANKENSSAVPLVTRTPLEPKQFRDGQYSKVGVNFGLTMSLGNFEFAKIDVSCEDFCAPDEKKETWQALSKEATNYLFSAAKNVKSYLNEKRDGLGF